MRFLTIYSQYVCGPETLRVKDDLREDEYFIYRFIFPLRIIPLPEFFIDRDIRVSENLNLGLEQLIWKKIVIAGGRCLDG